jgi:hypothetical protein
MTDHIIDIRLVHKRDGTWVGRRDRGSFHEIWIGATADEVLGKATASLRRDRVARSGGTPVSDDAIAALGVWTGEPTFDGEVMAKLRRGADEYGDGSFSRPADALLAEIQEECVDIAGWAYVLACAHPSLARRARQLAAVGLDAWRLVQRERRGPAFAPGPGALR